MYLSPVTLCLLLAYCFLKSFTHSSKLYISESNELVFLGSGSTSFWNSIFNSNEDRTHASARDNTANKSYAVPTPNLEHSFSTIQLREVRYLIIFSLMWFGCIEWFMETLVEQPPVVLKPSEQQSEQEALEIAITKLLLKSYYNIVRKNVEDFIPKAIMHFLVCDSCPVDLSVCNPCAIFFIAWVGLEVSANEHWIYPIYWPRVLLNMDTYQ